MKLIDVIDTPVDAIFCAMNDFDVPWKNENIGTQLDIQYLMNISGQKNISNVVKFFINTETGKIDDEDMIALVKIILSIYLERWTKLYATFSFEYDPISNYDMTEQMIDDTTEHTQTNNDTITYDNGHETVYGKHETLTNNLQSETEYGKSDTTTNNLQRTYQHGKTDTTTNNLTTNENITNTIEKTVAGFNSADYAPSEKEEQTSEKETTNTGTQTVASNGTDTERNTGTQDVTSSGSDTETNTGTQETVNSGKDTTINTGTDTTERYIEGMNIRNYTLTRKGNIGVTTSQQMIESERKLWLWDYFHSVIFPDCDKVLTIPYYGGV